MSLVGRNRRVKRRDIRRVLWGSAGALVVSGSLVAAHSFTLVRDSLRAAECDAISLGSNTRIYDRNQRLLSTIASTKNRQAVPFNKFPKHLVNATISIEDKRFYSHNGIDYSRVVGAFVNDLQSDGGPRQGGSTITMQLMKNLCHPSGKRDLNNKLSEAYFSVDFEKRVPKDEILKRYLNSVFLGNFAVGMQAASLTYFSKDVSKLTLPEAALLAGLPQAPSAYNPFQRPEAAIARRNLVLDEMLEDGVITRPQWRSARNTKLKLKRGNTFGLKKEGFFVDYIEGILTQELGRKKVKDGGYRVYTTINPRLQTAARNAMLTGLSEYFPSGGPSAAVVMIEAKTGRILTMASTNRYGQSPDIGKFNIAGPRAHRQAGSTFKTFVLTAALAEGISPNTTYYSVSPINISGGTCADPGVGPATVKTFSGTGGGAKNLVSATTSSDNSIYAQLTCDIGPNAVYEMARQMGIQSMVPNIDRYNIALGLGGLNRGVNVLEMARAYAPLANGGYRVNLMPMTKLVRPDGKVRQFKPKRVKILPDGVTAEVTKILRANVTGGTGGRANLPNVPVAGKTGTVDQNVDAWFVGYTPKYVTAVWVGYPGDRVPMPGIQVGTAPARIWGLFMAEATKGEKNQEFPAPKEPFESRSYSSYWTRHGAALAKPKEPETPASNGGGGGGATETPPAEAPSETPAPEPAPEAPATGTTP